MASNKKRYTVMKLPLLLLCSFWVTQLSGQNKDSLQLTSPKDSFIQKEVSLWPVPKKALLFGIIPGGGQLYNKKWWKVPLVYGALGAGGYWLYQNQKLYRFYRDQLLQEINMPGSTNGSVLTHRNNRDRFDKSTQQAYVYLGIIYLLQATEAFVDAHLNHFDVSDDLSWYIKPSTTFTGNNTPPTAGISLIIPISK